MPYRCDCCDGANALHDTRCLWVDLTQAGTALPGTLKGEPCCIRRVWTTAQVDSAIEDFAPHFLCFEFDNPDESGIDALALARRRLPALPLLMITSGHSEAVALWALRVRVWDLLIKPVDGAELRQRFDMLCATTSSAARRTGCERAPEPASENHPVPHYTDLPALNGMQALVRTQPAIAHVAAQFDRRILLDQVAALCRLSPSQFCRVFRHENGMSFGQYLLRYRIERACDRLGRPHALAKEVAYAVGFNDLSYFAWAFKRQVGVCPSRYKEGLAD
jgi:two-component system, response regulator YesN